MSEELELSGVALDDLPPGVELIKPPISKEIKEVLGPDEEPASIPATVQDGKDRVTLRLELYYQHEGDDPAEVRVVAHRIQEKTENEVWKRRVVVHEDWQPIDLGWFREYPSTAGILIIENLEGKATFKNPTPEEKAAAEAKVVEVSLGLRQNPLLVLPRWPQYLLVKDLATIEVRSPAGKARIRITILPSGE